MELDFPNRWDWIYISIILSCVFVIWSGVADYFLRYCFADWLIAKAKKTPYFHLGEYMERYWLIPYRKTSYNGKDGTGWVRFYKRPFAWVAQALGIAARVHKIKRSDKGRDYHNHPWPFITVILKGGYWEHTPVYNESGAYLGEKAIWYGAGSILFRRSKNLHRLHVPLEHEMPTVMAEGTWTLFITFWKVRTWGFVVEPEHLFIPHYEYEKSAGENND